jgi:hypothetical protein
MAPDVFFWPQHVFSSSSVSTEFEIARIPCEGFLAMPASIVYVYVVGVHKDTLFFYGTLLMTLATFVASFVLVPSVSLRVNILLCDRAIVGAYMKKLPQK